MEQTPDKQGDAPPLDPHTQFTDALLDNLTGEWRLSRKIGSRLAENHVRVEWILNHQFLQVHMIDVKSPQEYEALVLIGYNHEKGEYVVYWLDSFGGSFSAKGTGTRTGDSIRFVFQYPDGLLHNTFTWQPATATWRARIEQQDDNGEWSIFAEDSLRRP